MHHGRAAAAAEDQAAVRQGGAGMNPIGGDGDAVGPPQCPGGPGVGIDDGQAIGRAGPHPAAAVHQKGPDIVVGQAIGHGQAPEDATGMVRVRRPLQHADAPTQRPQPQPAMAVDQQGGDQIRRQGVGIGRIMQIMAEGAGGPVHPIQAAPRAHPQAAGAIRQHDVDAVIDQRGWVVRAMPEHRGLACRGHIAHQGACGEP
ncbi:hypothetical protein AZA_84445 [Nitrospirillum viridazoti Y2]|nr:hypothetical protein AZA_84445 [Nitrospirillum amazonense Y2]